MILLVKPNSAPNEKKCLLEIRQDHIRLKRTITIYKAVPILNTRYNKRLMNLEELKMFLDLTAHLGCSPQSLQQLLIARLECLTRISGAFMRKNGTINAFKKFVPKKFRIKKFMILLELCIIKN